MQQPPPPANWAPPIQTGPAPGVSYAGAGQRLIAYLVDGFIMGLVVWVFIILGGIVVGIGAASSGSGGGGLAAIGGVFFVVGFIIAILWKPYFWSHGGQTPAYKMLHMRVVRERDGGPLSFGQAFLRLIGYVISGMIFDLGFIWVLIDSRRQGFHDKIANTVVITA
jgi:uncharacterized RDD family membrane protein YckC